MAMYLVSDEELNTIIRLRRRDVTRLVKDLREQYPDASIEDVLVATDQFFAEQVVAYDYLANYAAEEIAYSTPEPAAEVEELDEDGLVEELEAEDEAPETAEEFRSDEPTFDEVLNGESEDLDGAAVEEVNEEPENVDPLTDSDPNRFDLVDDTVEVVDDTVQIVDDTAGEDVNPEPAADELTPEAAPTEEEPTAEVAPVEPQANNEVATRKDRASQISLRALQRELKQIDKV